MALYVYGVMRAGDCPQSIEVEHKDTVVTASAVQHGGLCALVSEVGDEALRVRRESLVAHSEMLMQAMAHGPVLPLRFGVVIADRQAVNDELLAGRNAELAARLDALAGKAEMQLKGTFREEPLLRTVLSEDPALARLAARVKALPDAAAHFERIRLGELIAQAVQAHADTAAHEITSALQPHAVALSVGQRQNERMAINAAFLVSDDRMDEFDAAVEKLGKRFGTAMELRLIGPMPPHSFVEEQSPAWA